MKILIETIGNGYLTTKTDGAGDVEKIAFTDDGYEKETFKRLAAISNEQVALGLLLEHIAELFGQSYDKYSESDLKISFDKKGHKVEI